MGAGYARNKDAVAICNRSGQKMLRSEMVEDGYLKGLLVHPDWFDPEEPQEKPFRADEAIAIYRPAPDLVPNPPSPVLSISVAGSVATLTWTESDPPASTVINYTVWRNTGSGFLRIGTVTPVVPVDLFISNPDLIQGELPAKVSGLTFTDNAWTLGNQYYVQAVTADTATEGGPGLTSAPSQLWTFRTHLTTQFTAVPPQFQGAPASVFAFAAKPGNVIASDGYGAFYRSTNGGHSWVFLGTLPQTIGQAFGSSFTYQSRMVWGSGTRLLAAASSGGQAVAFSDNTGVSWTTVALPTTSGSSSMILMTDGAGNLVAICSGVGSGNINWAFSTNNGTSWNAGDSTSIPLNVNPLLTGCFGNGLYVQVCTGGIVTAPAVSGPWTSTAVNATLIANGYQLLNIRPFGANWVGIFQNGSAQAFSAVAATPAALCALQPYQLHPIGGSAGVTSGIVVGGVIYVMDSNSNVFSSFDGSHWTLGQLNLPPFNGAGDILNDWACATYDTTNVSIITGSNGGSIVTNL
jgi:hypothetical protein